MNPATIIGQSGRIQTMISDYRLAEQIARKYE